jgi:thioredoxin-like negative regulator of GroEL
MAPIVDGLETGYGDRVAFQRLNADEEDGRAVAQTYRLGGHPAIVVVNAQGDVVWSRLGVQPRGDVANALESVLANESNQHN